MCAWTRTLVGGASSLGASSPGTFSAVSLTADTNQLVLDSDGTNPVTLTIVAPTAPRTISLPNATDTLVGKATTDTMINKTLTAPTITGPTITGTIAGGPTITAPVLTTPTIASIVNTGTLTLPTSTGTVALQPTITVKRGSGGGNYTSTSATYADVDATNLAFTVTIPTGQKLWVVASGAGFVTVGATTTGIALNDSVAATQVGNVSHVDGTNAQGWTCQAVITGDGLSHTVKLQFKTAANTITITNAAAPDNPQITFWMGTAA